MKAEEKIYEIMKKIKEKSLLSPENSEISYRAERSSVGGGKTISAEEKIMIINKLEEMGVIKITYNGSSDYE